MCVLLWLVASQPPTALLQVLHRSREGVQLCGSFLFSFLVYFQRCFLAQIFFPIRHKNRMEHASYLLFSIFSQVLEPNMFFLVPFWSNINWAMSTFAIMNRFGWNLIKWEGGMGGGEVEIKILIRDFSISIFLSFPSHLLADVKYVKTIILSITLVRLDLQMNRSTFEEINYHTLSPCRDIVTSATWDCLL